MQIGSLGLNVPIILAPMAGISNLPYRLINKKYGAGMVTTEMVSANGLIRDGRKTFELLQSDEREQPLAVQLFGDDPAVVAEGARRVETMGELIDINMGCPVKKVIRSGAGSALLKDPKRVGEIVAAVRAATRLPLTIKIRSGWDCDTINFLEIGRIAEAEGVDAITLHPRTKTQGFGGEADWAHIGELKAALSVPVVGSGDIVEPEDAIRMMDETGCDAVMIGRGAYGNPWLIANIIALLKGEAITTPSVTERFSVAKEHVANYCACFGEKKAMADMRKHLCWYSRGLSGATSFRASVNSTTNFNELIDVVDRFFNEAVSQSL